MCDEKDSSPMYVVHSGSSEASSFLPNCPYTTVNPMKGAAMTKVLEQQTPEKLQTFRFSFETISVVQVM